MSARKPDGATDPESDRSSDRDQCQAAGYRGDRCQNPAATGGLCAEHLRDPTVSRTDWSDRLEDWDTTTNNMTETDTCDAQKRDDTGDKCSLPAGWGTDHVGSGRCKLHGGASSGAPTGRDHGQYDHGGYTEAIEQDLRPAESRTVAELVGLVASTPYERQAATVAAYGLVRYLRSGDPRHAAVFRRQLEAADVIEADHELLTEERHE